MRLALRGHGSVALGHSGRLCAGDEIQRVQHGVACSDHPNRAVDLRRMTTAAAESLAARFLQAVHTDCSGALPWSVRKEKEDRSFLWAPIKLSGNQNLNEQRGCLRPTKLRAMMIKKRSQDLLAAAASFWC